MQEWKYICSQLPTILQCYQKLRWTWQRKNKWQHLILGICYNMNIKYYFTHNKIKNYVLRWLSLLGNAPYMVVHLDHASVLDICHPLCHTRAAMEEIYSTWHFAAALRGRKNDIRRVSWEEKNSWKWFRQLDIHNFSSVLLYIGWGVNPILFTQNKELI